VKPESKFWNEIKAFNIKNKCKLSFTRIENLSSLGCPDLLIYNANHYFFTVELKVTKNDNTKIKFSPHQIAFHVKHPNASFILVKALSSGTIKLYEGKQIQELAACGLKLEPCAQGLEACCLKLVAYGDLSQID
tara:strand:- start:56 stop:457 length:402 start_codon:yes stop_codon:yes gene_type:complete